MALPVPSQALVAEVRAGRHRGIARMITRAESGGVECRAALAELYRHGGRAHVVGITGVPGSGKSTLVRSLALAARRLNRTVGIVAIDPSSPFTGGAILGDRVRMIDLTDDSGIFMRSMATRGALGGLSRASLDAVDILDAAGFDLVLVETVGVGQDEVDIVQTAITTVVVSAPGLGDDIQAIKAGVLEIADIHAVSKCDRADADRTVSDLKRMLTLGHGPGELAGWHPPVLRTSAETGEGVESLLGEIECHRRHLVASGALAERQGRIAERRVLKTAEDMLRMRFLTGRLGGGMATLVERVAAREVDPGAAAGQLLAALGEE